MTTIPEELIEAYEEKIDFLNSQPLSMSLGKLGKVCCIEQKIQDLEIKFDYVGGFDFYYENTIRGEY